MANVPDHTEIGGAAADCEMEGVTVMGLPDLPPGARLLTVDDAVDRITSGDHEGAGTGSVALDVALIDALRAGLVVACERHDGKLAFTRPGNDHGPAAATDAAP